MPETETYGKILRDHNPTYLYPKRIHHHRPQTVGGFKKSFEEKAHTHEHIQNPYIIVHCLADKMVDKTRGTGPLTVHSLGKAN